MVGVRLRVPANQTSLLAGAPAIDSSITSSSAAASRRFLACGNGVRLERRLWFRYFEKIAADSMDV